MLHTSILFDYRSAREALQQGLALQPRPTFQECLQNLLFKTLLPTADDTTKTTIQPYITDLTPSFINAAINVIEDDKEPFWMTTFNGEWGAYEPPDWSQLWNAFETYMHTAGLISNYPDGIDAAFELFFETFGRMLDYIWHAKDEDGMQDDKLYILLDECLLNLCKKLVERRGVVALQGWRKRLVLDTHMVYLLTETYDHEAFLLRSMQYISEMTAAATVQVVVSKIVEGRLPNELSDMVFGCALQSYDIPLDDDYEATWAPADDFLEPVDCCISKKHPAINSDRSCLFWSRAERKYIRFHRFDVIRLRRAGLDLSECSGSLYLRCGAAVPTLETGEVELVPFRPERSDDHSWIEHFFVAGETVVREWRE